MLRASIRSAILLGLVLAVVSGCSSPDADPAAWRQLPHDPVLNLPPSVGCAPSPRPVAAEPWSLALPGGLDPRHAPLPLSEAERHVFRGLYEPLVRVDCDGRLAPGLATRWEAFDEGRHWILTLRPGATFWDGTPVTAAAVASSWRRSMSLCRRRGEPTPFVHFDPEASVTVLGERELGIRLRTPTDQLPLALAHPALAVVGRAFPGDWPQGSGPLRPDGWPQAGRLVLVPHAPHPERPAWPRLELLLTEQTDPRELLDTGVDALVTREREVVDYYDRRRGTARQALPWDRWYYLITPSEETGAAFADRRRWTSGWSPLELAREVSRQDAEPAAFFPFDPPQAACAPLPPLVPVIPTPSLAGADVYASRDADLVLWPRNDPDAGRLAERLAALAARPLRPGPALPSSGPLTPPDPPGPGRAPEAAGVDPDDLSGHVQAARAGAIVLPWPMRFPTPCDELTRLLSLGQWLQDAGLDGDASTGSIPPSATAADPVEQGRPPRTLAVARRLENGTVVQPLIRSRAHVIGRPAMELPVWAHDGALRLWTGGRR